MVVQLNYNPYLVKTEISFNGKRIDENVSSLAYLKDKRIQEWIEPQDIGNWPGFFKVLRENCGEKNIEIEFIGTIGDFEDLEYAYEKHGNCFESVKLIHKNKDTALNADPFSKMKKLEKLYQKLMDGPIDECKTDDIRKNFEQAINSEFRIVVVAPMSSGKSTLINSIIGKDLLPAVNQATTAVITEIKDNDQMENFVVSAKDKYGNEITKNQIATKELISELNYKKDPNDPEGKEALINLVQIEGQIPNIPSDVMNTVFVDTPGGNNTLNYEHEKLMDQAIFDENKSLILYVFNGAQLGTNDSNIILSKIANAMKNGSNGKQSRDRFLFVANRMDDFNPASEPYEEVINNTIIPQLKLNGIIEPKLFLASAQTAKMIRMSMNKEDLSLFEQMNLEPKVQWFNMPINMFSKYSSLNGADKKRLNEDAERYAQLAKEAKTEEEAKENRYKAADINSGIPAIELAIQEYLSKYALAIKIKTVHDTFMGKVNERQMREKAMTEWASSRDKLEEAIKDLEEKNKLLEDDKIRLDFKKQVDAIELDVKPIKIKQAEVLKEINDLVANSPKEVKYDEAEAKLNEYRDKLNEIGKDAQNALDLALNDGVLASCKKLITDYQFYIKKLDEKGVFKTGTYDVTQTEKFKALNLLKPEDLLNNEQYISKKNEKKTEITERKGLIARAARGLSFFADIFMPTASFGLLDNLGYKTETKDNTIKYVKIEDIIRDNITAGQHQFDAKMKENIDITQKKVDELKSLTSKTMDNLENMIKEQNKEIKRLLSNKEKLIEDVHANEEKNKWLDDFINEVEDLLTV